MVQIRKELIQELVKEIYGPREGPEEIITSDPFKEYITGVIIPKRTGEEKNNPDSEIIEDFGDDSSAQDDSGSEQSFVPYSELTANKKPSSFGFSFFVNTNEPEFEICVTFGMYDSIRKEDKIFNENKKIKKEWKRKRNILLENIKLMESEKKVILYSLNQEEIYLYIRKIRNNKNTLIIIYLINDLDPCLYEEKTTKCLFQPSIRLIFKNDTKIIAQKTSKPGIMDYLYKNNPSLARGFLVSAIWKEIDYWDIFDSKVLWTDGYDKPELQKFTKPDVRTEFIPLFSSPSPIFEWDDNFGNIPALSPEELSEIWTKDEIEKSLNPLYNGYKKWIEENASNHGDTQYEEISDFQLIALERMKEGIEVLKNDSDALLSFCFANKVISVQRKWKNPEDNFIWRPFQLAFILLNIESIYNDKSKYRDMVDLLWIPTGGGKTEAYLALMAFTISLRRRKNISNKETYFGIGTTVLTRYTLRLLTVQQYRRTLLMITAAEYLRVLNTPGGYGWRPKNCSINGDWIYGTFRFSVGLWVGGSLAPNHLRGNDYALDSLHTYKKSRGEPAQIIKCPICDSWLSIPNTGLPAGKQVLHVVIKIKKVDNIDEIIAETLKKDDRIKNVVLSSKYLSDNNKVITLFLNASEKLSEKEFDKIFESIEDVAEVLSFRASRPGYFGIGPELGRQGSKFFDFEIICPNPKCESTGIYYVESVPLNYLNENQKKFENGTYVRKLNSPFIENRKMPIPAYTVDEQVYHKLPTIIISTVDKIARLSYEPRASGIFGNINKYNSYYGFIRNDCYPRSTTVRARNENTVEIPNLNPPDLIVQDELHLIEGPLGSMYGHYEVMVNSLLDNYGGNPKHITSTATAKDVDYQIGLLYGKKTSQFPPFGFDINDNFFVRMKYRNEQLWDEKLTGRIFCGVYSPGFGPITPLIRLWSRLLKTAYDFRNHENAKYYWTIVGYFNAIRELGGGRSIFREDVIERLAAISGDGGREIDPEKIIELSSRIDSTDIPQLLEDLEKASDKPLKENSDSIFTTSMFGTGVDISHLSLMIVNGQPKTTSQYVQATGRVGRSHGALIVTFLRAGRARDLSHYEMFPSYHNRIYLEVESPSVSPFSEGTLMRASGPIMTAFLRNMRTPKTKWYEDDALAILEHSAEEDYHNFVKHLEKQIIKMGLDDKEIIDYFSTQFQRWYNIAYGLHVNHDSLDYVEYPFRTPEKHVLLGDPSHEYSEKELKIVYKNAPQSLREIEETTSFEV